MQKQCDYSRLADALADAGLTPSAKQVYEATHNVTAQNCDRNGMLTVTDAKLWWQAATATPTAAPSAAAPRRAPAHARHAPLRQRNPINHRLPPTTRQGNN